MTCSGRAYAALRPRSTLAASSSSAVRWRKPPALQSEKTQDVSLSCGEAFWMGGREEARDGIQGRDGGLLPGLAREDGDAVAWLEPVCFPLSPSGRPWPLVSLAGRPQDVSPPQLASAGVALLPSVLATPSRLGPPPATR